MYPFSMRPLPFVYNCITPSLFIAYDSHCLDYYRMGLNLDPDKNGKLSNNLPRLSRGTKYKSRHGAITTTVVLIRIVLEITLLFGVYTEIVDTEI